MFKKRIIIISIILVVGAFMALTVGGVQAAERSGPSNQPPDCQPILFTDEGYWGMQCVDYDNNIVSAEVKTDGEITNLVWDNTYAQMIVQTDGYTNIYWVVCDSDKACASGQYPN